MNRKRNLIVGLVAATATALTVLTTVSTPEEPSPSESAVDAATTEAPAGQGSCGYQWAYHNAPELTGVFNEALRELNADAEARVEFFGEDCVYADGTSTFAAMETDFYVRLPVEDLSQEEELGNWVIQVMEIVTQIPREELQGPQDGFVEFTFEKSETDRVIFRVPIRQYREEAQGKTGAEIFQLFYPIP